MSPDASKDISYIPSIDGLRAIAVLSVLLYHFDQTLLPGGFTGVDVFFVISGYVISKSLATNASETFLNFVAGFYRRRFLRILPAVLFFLIVTSVASSLFIPDAWLSMSNKWTGIWAFFGVSNFYLVSGSDGYFSSRIAFNPFVHTWSLAVEEQFYLFFPLFFYVWAKRRDTTNAGRILAKAALPVITLLSLGFAVYQSSADPVNAFYMLPSRLWELAAGGMLYQAGVDSVARHRTFSYGSWYLLAGGVLVALGFIYADKAAFPFPWALLPVVGTLLMLLGASWPNTHGWGIKAALVSKPMTYIGRISYSLYLWHWAVFTFFRWTVGLTEPAMAFSALVLTILLSSLAYHFIEMPLRQSKSLKRQPNWKILLGGLGTTAFLALGTGLMLQYGEALKLKLSVTTNGYEWSPYYPLNTADTGNDMNNTNLEHLIGAGKHIFVIGDSHAGAYTNMAKLAARDLGAKASIISRSGCPVAALITASKDSHECRDFEQSLLNQMKKNAQRGDVVLLASLRLPRLGDQWRSFDSSEVLSRHQTLADMETRRLALLQAISFIEKLQAMGLNVLIDAPKPIFRAPAFRCSDWFNKSNPVCMPGFTMDREVLMRYREPMMASIANLQRNHGVFVWDPFPALCDKPVCSAFDGDKPLFSDGDHLSGYGGRRLVPSFKTKLEEIWRPALAESPTPSAH